MASKTTLPKGVWFQRKRLASGEVVRYGYLGRGPGMAALGREGSPEFHDRLADLIRRTPQEGKVSHLAWRYERSVEFVGLADLTKRDYRRQLAKIRTKFGSLSVAAMSSAKICDHIYRWRDEMAKASPRQADYAVSVLGAMLGWCVKRGLIEHNRAAGVSDVYRGDRRAKVWSADDDARLLAVAPPAVARAAILAIETGLSQQDCLALPKSAIEGDIIVWRRAKNGTPVAIPISPALKAMLDALPATDSVNVLTKSDGLPWDPKANGFRNAFHDACESAGVTGLTFHDRRGTFITRRRALGWTAEETALCSGHKVKGEEGAQSSYVDRRTVAIENAKRLWARYYGPNAERSLQTALQTAPEGETANSL